jgi:hypothetical protein
MIAELKKELDWIPVLHTASKWEKVSADQYLLYNDTFQTKMFVSYSAIAIINQINSKNSIREITDKLTKGKTKEIDYERVMFFVYNKLYKNGILYTNDSSIRKKNSHIYLKRIIVSENILRKICKHLVFLFNKTVAILILLSCITSTLWIMIKNQPWEQQIHADFNYIIFVPGIVLLVLLHELGHCAALQYFGKNSKGIGLGFYFFAPTMFADVNPSWTLPAKKRIVVDLGGFYFQFIATTAYLVLYQISGEISLFNIASLSFFLFLFNMNPLINTDMYWFLADILNRTNLNSEAINELSIVFMKKRTRKLNIFLCLFGTIKLIFFSVVFVLITYFLFNAIYLLFTGNYMVTFRNILKDCLLSLGFAFFIKELLTYYLGTVNKSS